MSRKNVRVEIPRNADDLLKLAAKIIAKHLTDGSTSPLVGDMAGFADKTSEADNANTLYHDHKWKGEAEMERRDLALGLSKTQKSTDKGSILYMVTSVRDSLLGKFRGEEHQMGAWGFTVDTSHRSKKPDPPPSV